MERSHSQPISPPIKLCRPLLHTPRPVPLCFIRIPQLVCSCKIELRRALGLELIQRGLMHAQGSGAVSPAAHGRRLLIELAKKAGFLICVLIMVMDAIAGILGIEAEIAENKVKHLKVWVFECRDPSYHAFKLGLAACVLLVLAHAIGNLMGGCVCIWSKEDLNRVTANKQLAVASLIFSWIVLAVAFSMLMVGTLSNSKSRRSCGIAHHRLLSIGGVLCFIHGLFTVAYFVSAKATRKEDRMTDHQQRQRAQGQGHA